MPTTSTASPRVVVLDTNLVLSALVFASGRLAPQFKLSRADREELLADYLPYCRSVRIPARLRKLPVCRHANDQMFMELAAVGKAAWLVTGDEICWRGQRSSLGRS